MPNEVQLGGNCGSTGKGAINSASEVGKALLAELFNLSFHLWIDDEEKALWGGAARYVTKDGWSAVVCPLV